MGEGNLRGDGKLVFSSTLVLNVGQGKGEARFKIFRPVSAGVGPGNSDSRVAGGVFGKEGVAL